MTYRLLGSPVTCPQFSRQSGKSSNSQDFKFRYEVQHGYVQYIGVPTKLINVFSAHVTSWVKCMRCRCRNRQRRETHDPLPESFHPVFGWLLWFLVRLNLRNVSHEIHILRFDQWRAVEKPGSNVQDRKQDERKIVGDECRAVPFAFEKDAPATELEQCQIHASKQRAIAWHTRQMMNVVMSPYHAANGCIRV